MGAPRNVNAQSTGFVPASGKVSRALSRGPRAMPRGYHAAPIPLGTGRASRAALTSTCTCPPLLRTLMCERLSTRRRSTPHNTPRSTPSAQHPSTRTGGAAEHRLRAPATASAHGTDGSDRHAALPARLGCRRRRALLPPSSAAAARRAPTRSGQQGRAPRRPTAPARCPACAPPADGLKRVLFGPRVDSATTLGLVGGHLATRLSTCGRWHTAQVSALRGAAVESERQRTISAARLTGESTVSPRLAILARGLHRAAMRANRPQSEHTCTHRAGSQRAPRCARRLRQHAGMSGRGGVCVGGCAEGCSGLGPSPAGAFTWMFIWMFTFSSRFESPVL